MANHRLRNRDLVAGLGLVIVSIALFYGSDTDIDWDDAYISYRYARNAANGDGLTYNPGERIYGSTTLPWVLWLGFVSFVSSVDIPHVSTCTSAVLFPVNALLLFVLLRRAGAPTWAGALGGLLLLAAPHYLLIAVTGMETMFYTCLMLLSWLALQSRRWLAAGVLAGLTAATRLDGLAMAVALTVAAVLETLRERHAGAGMRRVAALWGGMLIPLVPFALFCYAYFGTLVPQTLSAKRAHDFAAGRWWMLEHFATGPGAAAGAVFLLGGLVVAAIAIRRRRAAMSGEAGENTTGVLPILPAVLAWLIVYVVAWTAVRIDSYPWYVAALGPASAILPVAALASRYVRRAVAAQAIIAVAGLIVLAWWSNRAAEDVRRFKAYAGQLERPRRDLAKRIDAMAESFKASIGAGGIGLIGWHCPHARIIDIAGLVTPVEVLRNPAMRPTLFFGTDVYPAWAAEYVLADEIIPPSGPPARVWRRVERSFSGEHTPQESGAAMPATQSAPPPP